LIDIGGEPSGMPPTEFAQYVRSEIGKWNKVAKSIGFKPTEASDLPALGAVGHALAAPVQRRCVRYVSLSPTLGDDVA
jgi:hypothetical protein